VDNLQLKYAIDLSASSDPNEIEDASRTWTECKNCAQMNPIDHWSFIWPFEIRSIILKPSKSITSDWEGLAFLLSEGWAIKVTIGASKPEVDVEDI
jgi:hypothetical protein